MLEYFSLYTYAMGLFIGEYFYFPPKSVLGWGMELLKWEASGKNMVHLYRSMRQWCVGRAYLYTKDA